MLIIYELTNKVFLSNDLGQQWDSLIFKQTTLINNVTISKNKNIYILLYDFNLFTNYVLYSKDLGKNFDTLKTLPIIQLLMKMTLSIPKILNIKL